VQQLLSYSRLTNGAHGAPYIQDDVLLSFRPTEATHIEESKPTAQFACPIPMSQLGSVFLHHQ
jgi:hypothetical protein